MPKEGLTKRLPRLDNYT